MNSAPEKQVQTVWFWYKCPECQAKIAIHFNQLEKGTDPEATCPKCKKVGWAKTNMLEATYSMGSTYGERPKPERKTKK